jgi:endonuclease YncB( thermonuclease family)
MLIQAAIALALVVTPALAADLTGLAQVVDGDSLVVQGRQVRLSGIDAPEWGQKCQKGGKDWMAGQAAAAYLKSLAEGRSVSCVSEGVDKYKRQIATCYLDGVDLNDRIVRAGWAIAYRRYSERYVPAEAEAKQAGLGIWQGECGSPEVWRHSEKP